MSKMQDLAIQNQFCITQRAQNESLKRVRVFFDSVRFVLEGVNYTATAALKRMMDVIPFVCPFHNLLWKHLHSVYV